MVSDQIIGQIKQIFITEYLYSLGYRPVKPIGPQLVYYSPLGEENTPSFFVNPQKNAFHDFSTGEKGDIIRLVRLLENCSFIEAVDKLKSFRPLIEPIEYADKKPVAQLSNHNTFDVVKIKPLENVALLEYLTSRKIDNDLARLYVSEAYYNFKDKRYFAISFKNDRGGLELRNKYNKGSVSPKTITTIEGNDSIQINLFEGFMDFLSALTYYNISTPGYKTIVLNSLSFIPEVLPLLRGYKQINVYFDNNPAGKKALEKVQNVHSCVKDYSHIYAPYDDFNSFLIEKHFT